MVDKSINMSFESDMKSASSNLVWIDLEMTGLVPEQDRIIEIATIVTDANLTTLEEGPNMAVYQSVERLEAMDEWNQTHHGNSGLIRLVKESPYTERVAASVAAAISSSLLPPSAKCLITDHFFLCCVPNYYSCTLHAALYYLSKTLDFPFCSTYLFYGRPLLLNRAIGNIF